jgi:Protein of unknown function (DUF3467)
VTAVQLLEQDDPRELVREGDRAKRETVVDVVQLEPERTSDHEAQVLAALPPFLQEPAEADGVELLALAVEQRHERTFWDSAPRVLVLPDLDELQTHVSCEQLLVMLHIVGERRTQPADGNDDDAHGGILRTMDDPNKQERHINIHFSPEIMAGVYANFANVSHSDYEFTITFARVDHEVEDDEVPGVVVSRINLSPRFMRELMDAIQDNYSKWQTREGIKNLPEYGGSQQYEEPPE